MPENPPEPSPAAPATVLRTAYPQTCERCRKEHVFGNNFGGEMLRRIGGLCLAGREWGHGCAEYAEAAKKTAGVSTTP